jgi:hypothetical protein
VRGGGGGGGLYLLSKPHEADGLTDGERRLGDRDVGRGWGRRAKQQKSETGVHFRGVEEVVERRSRVKVRRRSS